MALWQSLNGSENTALNLTMNTSSSASAVQKLAYCFMFDSTAIKTSRVVASAIIMLVSLIGNLLVLGATKLYMYSKDPRTTPNYLIANMAAADLIITLSYMPRTIALAIRGYEWIVEGSAGLILCKLVPSLYHFSIIACILTLVALSYERFSVVAWPSQTPLTVRRAKLVIVLIWLAAILARLPRLLTLRTIRDKRGILLCESTKPMNEFFKNPNANTIHDIFFKSAFYALPLTVIASFHAMTIFKIRKRARSQGNGVQNISKCRERMNRNVFKMVLSVTLAFVVCWMAYFVAKESVIQIPVHCNVTFIRYLLAHLNSAITPCLYAVFSNKYRRGFVHILRRICCRLWPQMTRRNSGIELKRILHENDGLVSSIPGQERRHSKDTKKAKYERNGSVQSTVKLLLL